MPNPDVVVDLVAPAALLQEGTADGSPPQFLTVPFQGGRVGRLDLSRSHAVVWASVLESNARVQHARLRRDRFRNG